MCAVNNRKFNSNKLTLMLEQISKSNITLSDIENAVGLFEKVSDILIQLKFRLSSLHSIENVNQNSNECVLQNQLKRLRVSSIELLSCKKNILKTKDHVRKVRKRAFEANTPIHEAKRRDNGEEDLSMIVQQPDVSTGLCLFDICYICKKHCTTDILRHEYYPWMCFSCGEFNFKKRSQMADLNGKVALVTGGRIKIGFEIVLKLLRCGASVIITTRFPNDARRRYELQNDFSEWTNRLHIHGLDLRFIPQVDSFCEYFSTHFRQLDIFIQNAAQTIRRPTVYYKALIDGERGRASITSNSNDVTSNQLDGQSAMQIASNDHLRNYTQTETTQLLNHPEDFKYACNSQLSQLHFPLGGIDVDGDQLDLRPKNTWTTVLNEVETQEMVEVTLANYMSPFILLKKLTPLMTTENRTLKSWSFVVLVSAMEGKFSRCNKTGKHPHTNAAKAALNMLVKTSAHDYKKIGILMNAVDTGWVTDEHPVGYKSRLANGLKTPLDSIDGAARVLDPILQTVNNCTEFPLYGKFLKDYRVVGW